MNGCATPLVLKIDVQAFFHEVIEAVCSVTLSRHVKHAETKGIDSSWVTAMINQCFHCVHVALERGEVQRRELV